MPAQRNQRSTRRATTRAGTTARRGNGGNVNGRSNNRAASYLGIDSRTAR
jgi:hypothetical protein